MKNIIVVASVLTIMIYAGAPVYATDQQPTPPATEPGPILPPPPKPRELLQRMREMMAQRPGQDSETMRQCQVIMRTAIFLDSPSAILGQKEALGLTADQTQKLLDIENEARQKAKTVLTEEQTRKLGVVPDKAVAVTSACVGGAVSNVEQMLENLLRGQGTAQPSEPSRNE